MTPLHTAARMALDALESLQGGCTDHDDGTVEAITVWCPVFITALREALAAPMPEPVAWQWRRKGDAWSIQHIYYCEVFATTDDSEVRALYAAPPAAPAVPLTDKQFADIVADASLAVDLAANPIKLLAFAREVLKAHGIGGGNG